MYTHTAAEQTSADMCSAAPPGERNATQFAANDVTTARQQHQQPNINNS